MRAAFYDNPRYKQKQSEITKLNWPKGYFNSTITPLEERNCQNNKCKLLFRVKPWDHKKYCSRGCAIRITNIYRKDLRVNKCLGCGSFTKRSRCRYCSNKCQSIHKYNQYINRWKLGLENGSKGISVKFISNHLKRYLLEKYQNKCSNCGWDKIHPITKLTPLEVNHIDGNADNNGEENLELLCPNCHSLTPNFRNLNKGNGRAWRLKKV